MTKFLQLIMLFEKISICNNIQITFPTIIQLLEFFPNALLCSYSVLCVNPDVKIYKTMNAIFLDPFFLTVFCFSAVTLRSVKFRKRWLQYSSSLYQLSLAGNILPSFFQSCMSNCSVSIVFVPTNISLQGLRAETTLYFLQGFSEV